MSIGLSINFSLSLTLFLFFIYFIEHFTKSEIGDKQLACHFTSDVDVKFILSLDDGLKRRVCKTQMTFALR